MGMIGQFVGASGAVTAMGDAAKGLAEVFTPSATRRMELSAEAQMAALRQLGEEYALPSLGWFDRLVNGLNRLPRPLLAFGTMGLFVYAMVDPARFAERMVGLNMVPEPLWWLLGAVVGFYFGAREAYYFRNRTVPSSGLPATAATRDANPALADWQQSQG
ncbi:MAG: holin family protein [Pseudorhodobacter sp.]|nr:holin family protein [Pseudorhodobacter sp.]